MFNAQLIASVSQNPAPKRLDPAARQLHLGAHGVPLGEWRFKTEQIPMKKYFVLAVVVSGAVLFGWVQSERNTRDLAPVTGAAMVDVTIPPLDGNASLGQAIFEAKCAACHGANAAGQDGVAPPLVHRIYEPSHHGDVTFLLAMRNGVRSHHWRFGSMLPVEGLSDGDVELVVEYVRALQRANGID